MSPGIRTRLEVDNTPLLDVESFYNDFHNITGDIAQTVFERVEPTVLDEARYEPQAAVIPFEFATPASRRYYLWAVRTGKIKTSGGRYQRSHRLSQKWIFRFVRTDEGAQFVLENGALEAKWVYGSFDQRRNYQVPGHRNTGWVPINETAEFILDLTYDEYVKEFDRVIPREYGRTRGGRRNR